jgi:hypothetical protein
VSAVGVVVGSPPNEDAEEIQATKRGEWSLEWIRVHAGGLLGLVDGFVDRSASPERPYRERVDATLGAVTLDWLRASAQPTSHLERVMNLPVRMR